MKMIFRCIRRSSLKSSMSVRWEKKFNSIDYSVLDGIEIRRASIEEKRGSDSVKRIKSLF